VSTVDQPGLGSAGGTGAQDQRPLTAQEYQLLQRLLSDPFSLPIQFKTWLVSYLETSDLSLPLGAIQGLTTLLGITGVGGGGTLGTLPAGLILPYGGTAAPTGSKMCDGGAYTRAAEQRLYQAIGTTYGAPDANTFNVPDIQERFPVGRGSKAEVNTLGANEGKPLGQRGPSHGHSGVTASHSHGGGVHSHTVGRDVYSLTPGGTAYSIMQGAGPIHDAGTDNSAATIAAEAPAVTVGPQSGAPVDRPGFITVNFIIVA